MTRQNQKSQAPHQYSSPEDRISLLRIPEVAERLAISSRSVHRLISRRMLPAVKVGRSTRIQASALERFVRAGGGN